MSDSKYKIINPDNVSKSLIKPPDSRKIKSGLVVLEQDLEIGEHVTYNREEIIFIVDGTATVIIEEAEMEIHKNQMLYVAPEVKHNVINRNVEPLKYIYIVSPIF